MRSARLPRSDDLGFRLLNDWQRDFPLQPRPFAAIGEALGVREEEVLARYRRMCDERLISRIGAVLAPRRFGASSLAALAAPPERLTEVARRVSSEPTVNHNYQREHRLNLWFVVTARDQARLEHVVRGIEADTACRVLLLPLEEAFHIDLGFDLRGVSERRVQRQPVGAAAPLADASQALLQALQPGLALVRRPYAVLASTLGLSEQSVVDTLAGWLDDGTLSRFGVVVRHHELGLSANAMCVWDVPDADVSAIGQRLAREPAVTLCYRRRRIDGLWRYNLFCMIHGSDRAAVAAEHAAIVRRNGLHAYPGDLLFSLRRFKQTGAHYLPDSANGHA